MHMPSFRNLLLAVFLLCPTLTFAVDPYAVPTPSASTNTPAATPPPAAVASAVLLVTPEKPSAIYQPGEKIVWDVKVTGDNAAAITTANYVLKKGGAAPIGQGTVNFVNGEAKIETSLNEPGTILAQITAPNPGQKDLVAAGGAAIAPDQLKPSAPCPDDFDSFWKSKLDLLATIPPNAVLTKEDSGKPGVDYWKITLDNINGTHVQGQLARPTGADDKKLPALLIVQWAGVYPLQKAWATDRAAEGWLVLNVMAHDLPIDQPKEFYDEQAKGALNHYTAIGDDDREKSYFLRMFLGDMQAATYLTQRPDWDGKTLVVTGGSQGGMQSFAVAGLDPKITAMLVMVPAGCDNIGRNVGRQPGWPNWTNNPKAMDTSRYFDPVNFASRIKCPALIGLGLIDVTAPPSGIFAASNQIPGQKEMVVMPLSEHQGKNNSQAPYYGRWGAWLAALRTTGMPPPPKS
jgi:cephalosporin-C deacetylase-like acetyl esterase